MKFITIMLLLCAVSGLLLIFRRHTEARNFQLFGKIINRVNTENKIVALTFDDGPNPPYTEQILSILKTHNVKATFFVLGARLKEHPNLASKIVQEGHELANHSFSHKYLLFRPPHVIKHQVLQTDEALRRITPNPPPFFRPPFGKKFIILPWLLRKMGKTTVMCDVEASRAEMTFRDSLQIRNEVLQRVKPGSIIMLHDGGGDKSPTVKALGMILKELKKRCYTITSVTGLIREVPQKK